MKPEHTILGNRYRVIPCEGGLSEWHREKQDEVVTLTDIGCDPDWTWAKVELLSGVARNFNLNFDGLVPILTKEDIVIGETYKVLKTYAERAGVPQKHIASGCEAYF